MSFFSACLFAPSCCCYLSKHRVSISRFAPLFEGFDASLPLTLYHTGVDVFIFSFSILGDGRISGDSGDLFSEDIRRISVITPKISDF
jgi:hypothetical protein